MPHRARPMTGLLLFTGVNLVLLNTITPVYDFVCFHPYWERRVGFNHVVYKMTEQKEGTNPSSQQLARTMCKTKHEPEPNLKCKYAIGKKIPLYTLHSW
ncbi:Os11g0136701 [Oryza sativa Japonica Group]|uniref:Os11g0136701 protein n=1 Tax=Oryza sativa subsp. japonica TaxID=39947 RepID=C7J8N8_ORYSJ|nr:Os11g0136701 [Oryza sativa Japonica Group]|eukprot:NP_001176337.1 Os11g0136701 [Oryza sativa Japonica Group]